MSTQLCWQTLVLGDEQLSATCVEKGEYVRLQLARRLQEDMLGYLFPDERQGLASLVHLKLGKQRVWAGSPLFHQRVGVLIHQHGALANLSIKENLLLPFLYHADATKLQRVYREVDEVAELLGLAHALQEKAGERSSYTHALISLGRCLLQKPEFVVAQEIHTGMPPERLQHFRDLALQALQSLEVGLLYLTASEHEGSGLVFSRTLCVQPAAVEEM